MIVKQQIIKTFGGKKISKRYFKSQFHFQLRYLQFYEKMEASPSNANSGNHKKLTLFCMPLKIGWFLCFHVMKS